MPQVEQDPSVCDQHMNDDGDLFAYCAFLIAYIYVQRQSATMNVAPYPTEKLRFGLISHVLGTTTFSKRECKRMGKRMYASYHSHTACRKRKPLKLGVHTRDCTCLRPD